MIAENTYHKFHSPLLVARQLFRGKSLLRSLFNLTIKDYSINGKILDIGNSNQRASYLKYFNVAAGSELIFTDIKEAPEIVYLDVTQPFPFADESLDFVLAFHLFEHVYNYQFAPKEILRILRDRGYVFVAVPFLYEYHADPDDYFRFTDSSLRLIWENVGLECVHIEAIGEGILTACATKLPSLLVPKFMRSLMRGIFYLITTPFDRLIALRPPVDGKTVPVRYALEYFAIFQKKQGAGENSDES